MENEKENVVITVRKLKKELGSYYPYATTVGLCKAIPKTKKGQMRRYEVLVDELPSRGEFMKVLNEKFKTPLSSLLSDAFCDIEALGEEINEWWENMGENLQCSSKGEELEECFGVLEYIEEVTIDNDALENIKISFIPTPAQDVTSRGDRLQECVSMITLVKEYLSELVEDEDNETLPLTDEEKESIQDEAIDPLDEVLSELENVYFPSMY